jgi:hypothetical protein
MTQVSSRRTWFYKRMFPVFWLGGLAVFAVAAGSTSGFGQPFFLIAPILIAAFGIFFMKTAVWPLMDEVLQGDGYLAIRKGTDEERISLSDIVNVNFRPGKPALITLRLRQPGRFGDEITFMTSSQYSFNPFAKNPTAEALIAEVDRARMAERGRSAT